MSLVQNSILRKEIEEQLDGADLQTITSKKIRMKLEEKFKTNFTSRKQEIDSLIMDIFNSKMKSQSTNESSTDSDVSELSDLEDAQSSKAQSKSKPSSSNNKKAKPTKKAKTSSKPKVAAESNSAPDSDDPVEDEELAWKIHLQENRPRRSVAQRPKKTAVAANKAKVTKRKSQSSAYSKACSLSDSLANVLGCTELPRHEVVKKMWDIAKERDLFDQKNKQFIICDSQLEGLFGRKRVRMFGIMKHLKNHIWSNDE